MKRKVFIFMIFCLSCFGPSICISANTYTNDVGKTVNFVRDNLSSFSVNDNYYVFDLDKLYNDFDIITKNGYDETTISEVKSSNTEEFYEGYSTNCGLNASLAKYSNNVFLSNNLNISNNTYSYNFYGFYSYRKVVKNKLVSLSNLKNDMSNYYSSEFVELVMDAVNSNKEEDFFRIFNNYGIHIVLSATYGNLLEKNAMCASNDSAISNFVNNEFSSTISLCADNTQVNSFLNSSLKSFLGSSNYTSSVYTYESNGFIPSSSNRLVPIWEYFNFDIRSIMEKMYIYYSLKMNSERNVVSIVEGVFPGEKTITDDGRDKQDKNQVMFDPLYNKYYKEINIKVTLDARQIDKGNSYVLIYFGNSKEVLQLNTSPKELGLEKGKNFKNVYESINVPINIEYNSVWILYGATGSGNDDWKKKNVKVYLEFRN